MEGKKNQDGTFVTNNNNNTWCGPIPISSSITEKIMMISRNSTEALPMRQHLPVSKDVQEKHPKTIFVSVSILL